MAQKFEVDPLRGDAERGELPALGDFEEVDYGPAPGPI
jgi:hypothetical protein